MGAINKDNLFQALSALSNLTGSSDIEKDLKNLSVVLKDKNAVVSEEIQNIAKIIRDGGFDTDIAKYIDNLLQYTSTLKDQAHRLLVYKKDIERITRMVPAQIGKTVSKLVDSDNLGALVIGYEQYINQLDKAIADKIKLALQNVTANRKDIVPGQGLSSYNQVISNVFKESRMSSPASIGIRPSGKNRSYGFVDKNTVKPVSSQPIPKEIESILKKAIQESRTRREVYGQKPLPEKFELINTLNRIKKDLERKGLVISGYEYNSQTNQLALMIGKIGSDETRPLQIGIANKNLVTVASGTQVPNRLVATQNWKNGSPTGARVVEVQQQQLLDIEQAISNIDVSASLSSIVRNLQASGQKSIRRAPHTAPNTIEDFFEKKEEYGDIEVGTPMQNAIRSTVLDLRPYIEGMVRAYRNKGNQKVKFGDIYEALTMLLSNPQNDNIIRNLPGLIPLRESEEDKILYKSIQKFAKSLRDQIKGFTFSTVSENSMNTGLIGTEAFNAPSAQSRRLQNLGGLETRNNSIKTVLGFSSPEGKKYGLQYGKKGGFGSSVGLLQLNPDLLLSYIDEYNKLNPKRQVSPIGTALGDGNFIISETMATELKRSLEEVEVEVPEAIFSIGKKNKNGKVGPEVFKRNKASLFDTLVKQEVINKELGESLKGEDGINNLSTLLSSDFVNDGNREQIIQAIGEWYFKTMMRKEGRKTRGETNSFLDQGKIITRGLATHQLDFAERVVDTIGNLRGAVTTVPDDFIKWLSRELNIGDNNINAITMQPKKYDLRSAFGAALGLMQQIHSVYQTLEKGNITNASKRFLEDLDKYNLGSLRTALTGIDEDGLIIRSEQDLNKVFTETATSLRDIIINLDKWNSELLKISRTFNDLGEVVQDFSVTQVGLAVRNVPRFGSADAVKGAVSGAAFVEHLKNLTGISVANKVLSPEEGQAFAEYASRRFGPSEAQMERLEQARIEQEEALNRTIESSKKDQIPQLGDRKYISIGFGEDYDINLYTVQEEVRDVVTRQVVNESETLRGRIKNIQLERQRQGEEQGIPWIDIGRKFGKVESFYGKGRFLGGQALFLPVSFGQEGFGDYYGHGNRDTSGVDIVLSLLGKLKANPSDDNLFNQLNDQILQLMGRIADDVFYKKGTEYEKAYKTHTPGTGYLRALPLETEYGKLYKNLHGTEWQELSPEQKIQQHQALIAQTGALTTEQDLEQFLRYLPQENIYEIAKYITNDEHLIKNWTPKELFNYVKSAFTLGTEEYKKYVNREDLQGAEELRGLSTILARYPLINDTDIPIIDLWATQHASGAGGIKLSSTLANILKADYDGDQIAAGVINFFDTVQKIILYTQQVSKKLYNLISSTENNLTDIYGEGISNFVYSPVADEVSGILSRTNKTKTGVLSLYHQRVNNYLRESDEGVSYNLSSLLQGEITPNKLREVTLGVLISNLFESTEQDAISAKKSIDRIGGELSQNDIDKTENFDAVNSLIRQIRSGADFDKVKETLTKMNLVTQDEDGNLVMKSSRLTPNLLHLREIARAQGLEKEFYSMFGSEDKLNNYINKGVIPVDILHGVFGSEGDLSFNKLTQAARSNQYTPIQAMAETNPVYRLGVSVTGRLGQELPIDEYRELGQTVEDTNKRLQEEIKTEQMKISVANKEGEAINNSAKAYEKLGTEVGKTKERLRSLTVTDYLAKLSPAYTNPTAQTYLSNKAQEFLSQGRTFNDIDEMARAYGYDSVDKFLKDRGELPFTNQYGTYAHAIVELLSKERVGKNDVERILSNLKPETLEEDIGKLFKDKGRQEVFKSLVQEYKNKLSVLGFDTELENARGLYGGIAQYLGSEIGVPKDADVLSEFKIDSVLGNTQLRGKGDKFILTQGDGENSSNRIDIIDFKNRLKDEASIEEFAQLAIYAKGIRQTQEAWEEFRKAQPDGDFQDFLKILKEKRLLPSGVEEDDEYLRDLKKLVQAGTDTKLFGSIHTLDRSTGKLIKRSIDLGSFMTQHPEEFNKLLNLEYKSLDELPVSLLKGNNPNIPISLGGTGDSEQVRALFSGKKNDSSPTEEEIKRLNEYLNLLKEQKNILFEIYKLEQEQKVLKQKQDDTGLLGNRSQLKDLRKLKKSIEAELQPFEEDEAFQKKYKKRIEERKAIIEDESRYNKDKWSAGFKVQSSEQAEKELSNLLSKRLSLEKQIEAAKKSISISYSHQEKVALQDVVRMTEQEIALLDEKIGKLNRSGLIRKQEGDSINRQYLIEQRSMKANSAARNHGAQSIWDLMKYDMSRAVSRIFDYGMAFRILNSIPQILRKINTLTQQLDESLMNIRVVTGYNQEEAQKLIITYQKLGKELGATTQEVANSANEWLRQGYNASEAGKLIEASTKLSKLGMISSSQATEYLTSALKGFKIEAEGAINIVDKLTKVDMEAAVSAGDIAEGLSRTATSAQLAGLNMDQTVGILSTIGEVTQKSMSSVGESLKTLLSRYGNVKAGVFSEMGLDDDGETAENINDIEKVLGKLGIPIRSSSLEMRNIGIVLDDLATKWNTLDTVAQNAVATAFAGVRQRENFNVMMENYDRVKELTEESANSAGTADEKYTAYMDSLEAKLKGLSNAWEDLTIKIEASPLIKGGTEALTWFIENLDRILGIVISIGSAFAGMKMPVWWNSLVTKITGNGQLSTILTNALGPDLSYRITQRHNANVLKKNEEIAKYNAEHPLNPKNLKKEWVWRNGKAELKSDFDVDTPVVSAVDRVTNAVTSGFNQVLGRMSGKNSVTNEMGGHWNNNVLYRQGKVWGLTQDESGVHYVGANGQIINRPVTNKARNDWEAAMTIRNKEEEEIAKAQANQLALERKKMRSSALLGIATSGIVTGVTSGLMTSQVNGIGDTADQTVQATAVDKAITGATTGALTALGSFAGPIGAMIGNIVGGELSKLFTYWYRKEDLERQQRVEEAEKQLEVLSKVSDALINYSDLVENEHLWDTEDYSQAKAYVRELQDVMQDSVKLQQRFVSAVQKEVKGMENADLSEVFAAMLNGTAEQKEEIDKQLQLSILRQTKEEQINAKEELDYIENQLLTNAGHYLGKDQKLFNPFQSSSLEETIEKVEDFLRGYNTQGRTLNKSTNETLNLYLTQLKETLSSLENAEEIIKETEVGIGYLASGVDDYTQKQLKTLTYEGVVNKIADAMEAEGMRVRDGAGIIKDEYLSLIESAIKAESAMSSIIKGESQTYNELLEKQEKFNNLLTHPALAGYTYDSLRELLTYSTKENQEKIKDLAEILGLTEDNLKGLIYAADPTKIEDLAWALNLPIKKLEELKEILGDISQSDAFLSLGEIREKSEGYLSLYEDLSANGRLTQENLEKMLSTYPDLLESLLGNTDNGKSLQEKLVEALFGDQTTLKFLYSQGYMGELLTSDTFFDNFVEKYESQITKLPEKLRKAFENAGSFEEIKQWLFSEEGLNSKELQEALQEYFDFTVSYEQDNTLLDKVIEYETQLLDDQIDSLEKQKEALSANNDERKKELELIKAKEALENSRKEKKRVYREGVGFVYEADEEAISEARDKLEELETQKEEDLIQLEIDKLNLQKEILEAIPDQQETEALKNVYEEWSKNLSTANDETVNIVSRLSELYEQVITISGSDFFKNWSGSIVEQNEKELEKIGGEFTELDIAYKNLYELFSPENLAQITADNFKDFEEDYEQKVGIYNDKLNNLNDSINSSNIDEETIEEYLAQIETNYFKGMQLNDILKNIKNTENLGVLPSLIAWLNYISPGTSKEAFTDLLRERLFPEIPQKAVGDLSFNGGKVLLNELGTEGIITPSGTFTTLPSKSGIVPADVTANVWKLGEVAPNLIARLESLDSLAVQGSQDNVTNNNGTFIDYLSMTVYPTKDYDMDKFIQEVQTHVRLSKNKK